MLIVQDPTLNIMQEFHSSPQFTLGEAAEYKRANKSRILDMSKYHKVERKNFPQKNFIEESLLADVCKRYKYRYGNKDPASQQPQPPALSDSSDLSASDPGQSDRVSMSSHTVSECSIEPE